MLSDKGFKIQRQLRGAGYEYIGRSTMLLCNTFVNTTYRTLLLLLNNNNSNTQ